ncbi:MAG: hypothetical protein EOP11_00875 [Proteobacteria bacterium]|nr:MAG: hypothetical protein EOP11_00875 [Pseudomonadota bacterium]
MKALAILQNADFESPGALPGWAEEMGFSVRTYLAYEEGLPALGSFSHLVVLGTPHSVHDIGQHSWLKNVQELTASAMKANRAVLGICFGAQLMAQLLGGEVAVGAEAEIGWHGFTREPWPASLPRAEGAKLFQWHREFFTVPAGAEALGISAAGYASGFRAGRNIAVSGHLEMTEELVELYIQRCWSEAVRTGPFCQGPELMRDQAELFRATAFAKSIFTSWLGQ